MIPIHKVCKKKSTSRTTQNKLIKFNINIIQLILKHNIIQKFKDKSKEKWE